MEYLKVWTSFREVIAPLNDSEKGRLFDAMLIYADTGAEPSEFKGNERFLWPVAKQDIDRTAQKCEALKANASKGGLAKSRNKQMLANDSKSYQTVANDSNSNQTEAKPALNIKKSNIKKDNNKEKDIMFDRFWAAYPRKEAKPKAHDAFIKINPDEELLEKMLTAIEKWKASDQWNENNGQYIPHPTTWLNQQRWNDEPPKKNGSPVKQVVVAQRYDQRDYSSQQTNPDDVLDRLEDMMNVS